MQGDANEVGLRIRLPASLRAQFVAACKESDSTASRELRAFMRRFVERHQAVAPASGRRAARPASRGVTVHG